MDDKIVNFSHIRFNEIKAEMTRILEYQFLLASVLTGDNLIDKSNNLL